MEDALVNLDVYAVEEEDVFVADVEAMDLTLVGLTHSAWWERSLVLEMGLSQNSQGIMTTSSLELFSVALWLETLVTTSAAVADLDREELASVADLDREELATRLMLLDLKVQKIKT